MFKPFDCEEYDFWSITKAVLFSFHFRRLTNMCYIVALNGLKESKSGNHWRLQTEVVTYT